MKTAFTKRINSIVTYIEMIIAIIILVALVCGIVGLVLDLGFFHGDPFNYENFSTFLEHAFGLVIGIEFIRMLIKHTPGSVVEVLLFAIARGLIVEHSNNWETLVGIVAIAAVFAIRKYLFVHTFEERDHAIFSADMSARAAKHITLVKIPYKDGDTLADVICRELKRTDTPVEENAEADFPNVTLRVHAMRDGLVTSVEVIPRNRH